MGWNIARVQSYIVRGSFYAALPKHLIFIGCFFLSPGVRKRHIIEFDSLIVFADAFVFNIPERHRRDARAFFAYYAMTGRAIPKVQ